MNFRQLVLHKQDQMSNRDTIASHNSYRRKIGLVSLSQLLSYPISRDAIASKNMSFFTVIRDGLKSVSSLHNQTP